MQPKNAGREYIRQKSKLWLRKQWLFDSLVKFHYVHHRTKQHRSSVWPQKRGFPKAKRLMQAIHIWPSSMPMTEQSYGTDLQTSNTYVYLSGNHTNSSTRWDGRRSLRSPLLSQLVVVWKHKGSCAVLRTSVLPPEPSTTQNAFALRLWAYLSTTLDMINHILFHSSFAFEFAFFHETPTI